MKSGVFAKVLAVLLFCFVTLYLDAQLQIEVGGDLGFIDPEAYRRDFAVGLKSMYNGGVPLPARDRSTDWILDFGASLKYAFGSYFALGVNAEYLQENTNTTLRIDDNG